MNFKNLQCVSLMYYTTNTWIFFSCFSQKPYTIAWMTNLLIPSRKEKWSKVRGDFETMWNFPHCIGALDVEYIRIECPNLCGWLYHHYKAFLSICFDCDMRCKILLQNMVATMIVVWLPNQRWTNCLRTMNCMCHNHQMLRTSQVILIHMYLLATIYSLWKCGY